MENPDYHLLGKVVKSYIEFILKQSFSYFSLYNPERQPPPFGFPVGRGDLDPLGRGGPGNLFPFPSHPDFRLGPDNGGFGPGAPRPRFDPFGPPERSIRPNPNPDHLPPPGFGGDYFM